MFGLRNTDMEMIISILQKEKSVSQALIFGSRAKGNYRYSSDVDIVLKGSDITSKTTAHIGSLLNDCTLMPYKFDVLNYNSIDNKDLIDHIDRIGKIIYEE